MTTTDERYGMPLVLLHWLLAILVIGVIFGGWIMGDLAKDDPLRPVFFFLHKSTGILILLLVAVRLAVRVASRVPPLPASSPAWERLAAKLTVVALYALMFATPIVGWLMSSAFGKPAPLYGLAEMPMLIAPNEELGEGLEELHEGLGNGLAALVGLHVAAAFWHHFGQKDGLLLRMMPTKKG